MAQMKEQSKAPEKELNKMKISNLSDVEFKTLVIRMFKELFGCFNRIKKTQAEMKVTLSEIKKNLQGTNSGGNGAKNEIKDWGHKEGKNIPPEKQEEKRIQTNKDVLRSLNIRIIRVPEGEKNKKLKTYLKYNERKLP